MIFWGSFRFYGVVFLLSNAGMINAEKYNQVSLKKIVKDFANSFLDGCGLFLQDSAQPHNAEKVINLIKEIKIKELRMVKNSPDINSNEN